MKGFVFFCAVLALLISTPVQSQTLYDDFTGPLLNSSKWFGNYKIGPNISNYLEIGQVVSKNKLDMFNHCQGSTEDGDTGYTVCATRLVMQDGADIKVMEVLIQPTGLELIQNQCVTNDSGGTWIRMGGAFFNSTLITGTVDGQLNDIQAHISLTRDANSTDPAGVFTIEGRVYRCTDNQCNTTVLVTTEPPGQNPIILGTVNVKKKILLKIQYDPTNHRFLFKQGKKEPEVAMVYAPRENYPPGASNGGYKRLEIRHQLANCTTGASSGWARVLFDNLYITK